MAEALGQRRAHAHAGALGVGRAGVARPAEAAHSGDVVQVVRDGDLWHEIWLQLVELPAQERGFSQRVSARDADVQALDLDGRRAQAFQLGLEHRAEALLLLDAPAQTGAVSCPTTY